MPPLERYILVYIVCGLILLILFALGIYLYLHQSAAPQGEITGRNWLIYLGVWIAFLSIVSTSWTQWRTSSTQHTLGALQTLRTDREYLIAAAKINQSKTPNQKKVRKAQVVEILKRESSHTPDHPTLSDATFFVLNQYEFMAAAAKLGAMDRAMLEKTIKGVVCNYVPFYQPLIKEIREKHSPTAYENLVWLYREFSGDCKTNFGEGDGISNKLRAK